MPGLSTPENPNLPDFLSLRAGEGSLVPYALAWEFQKRLVERRIRDEIPDTFLFVEHPPTITRGRGLQKKPGSDEDLRAMPMGEIPSDTEYFEIERGGDLTWHGPGQLVVYPIVKLDGSGFGPNRDVIGFLRKLETTFGDWFATRGLLTESRENAAGIWTAMEDRRPRKIASIGIAVRKWVAYHGIGLNLANALDGFRAISPCGFDPDVMTTLAIESPGFKERGWSESVRGEVEREIASAFAEGVGVRLQEVRPPI